MNPAIPISGEALDIPGNSAGVPRAADEADDAYATRLLAAGVPPIWRIDDAVRFARLADNVLRTVGAFCAITGGVLTRGYSWHDLDIVVLPLDSSRTWSEVAIATLASVFELRLLKGADEMRRGWREKGLSDEKHVEAWLLPDGRRVDLIVVRR